MYMHNFMFVSVVTVADNSFKNVWSADKKIWKSTSAHYAMMTPKTKRMLQIFQCFERRAEQ